MKHKVKITILSALGVWLVGSSVAYAYSQKRHSDLTEKQRSCLTEIFYVEELYENRPVG